MLRNLKFHDRIHNSPPPIPILSLIKSVHFPLIQFLIHFNITLPSMSGSSSGSFLQVSPPKLCIHLTSPHTCYMPTPSHSSNLITQIKFGGEYRSLSSFVVFSTPITLSLLGPNIILRTPFSRTLSLHQCE